MSMYVSIMVRVGGGCCCEPVVVRIERGGFACGCCWLLWLLWLLLLCVLLLLVRVVVVAAGVVVAVFLVEKTFCVCLCVC